MRRPARVFGGATVRLPPTRARVPAIRTEPPSKSTSAHRNAHPSPFRAPVKARNPNSGAYLVSLAASRMLGHRFTQRRILVREAGSRTVPRNFEPDVGVHTTAL